MPGSTGDVPHANVLAHAAVVAQRDHVLCRLNRHKWVRRFNADGEDYLQCKACGKDLYHVERHDPDIAGGFGAGGGMGW